MDCATDSPDEDSGSLSKDSSMPTEGDSSSDGNASSLSPSDIQFAAVNPMPSGEQIVFNDWNASPNELVSLTPDGKTRTTIFRALRIWSFGVSRAGDEVAFSCADPLQEQHYGVTYTDSIQQTWLFDVSSQTIKNLASGNINDECHIFGPADSALYVCRRYDFQADGQFKGWRIGRIDLKTRDFLFLTEDMPHTYDLDPQPLLDGKSLIFERLQITPPSTQQSSIMQLPLPSGTATSLRSDAARPSLSPEGSRYIFKNANDSSKLYSSKLDGTASIKLTDEAGTDAVWSPDGTRVAYLLYDNQAACSHIQVVASDGSQVQSPTRLRDCTKTGEFISQLTWLIR
jgi:hypothetical protein